MYGWEEYSISYFLKSEDPSDIRSLVSSRVIILRDSQVTF